MKVTKGRWDDNCRIYRIDPIGNWSEAISVFMDKDLSTFAWRKPEIGSISFRGLSAKEANEVAKGFEKAKELAEAMYREVSS